MTTTEQMRGEFVAWAEANGLAGELDVMTWEWKAWQGAAITASVAHQSEVQKLREEIARLTYVEEAYKAECTDFDRVLAKIGVTAEDARTEGGVLQVARICNHLQETYDALCLSQEFGADMVSKYSASSKQLSAAQSLLAMQHEALKEVNNHPISFSSKTVLAALSASAETVAAWEALWLRNSNAQKVMCKHGHPFTEENTYYRSKDGRRICKACQQRRGKKHYQQRKENGTHRNSSREVQS